MTTFIVRRLIQTVITIVMLSFICFYILSLMPGDPVDILASSNPHITSEDVARLKALYGLDKPAHVRYFNWLKTVTAGDLGYSRTYKIPVSELIGPRLMNTFYLSISALLLSLLIALPLGIFAALKQGTKFDYIINLGAFAGISVPSFWLGIVLILAFSVWLGFFPAGGTFTVGAGDLHGWDLLKDRLTYMVLPVLSLTALQLGSFVRYARSSMVESMRADYIRTARAKGLDRLTVVLGHGFRNALIPLVTVVAISFSFIFSGAIITETVFAYQGVGKLVYDSVIANDFNVAMVAFMISIAMVLLMNLVADILYGYLDPRISYG